MIIFAYSRLHYTGVSTDLITLEQITKLE